MHNKFLLILAVWLLTGPVAANAELVQSSTSVYLTFRHCVSGETVCDSIVPVEVGRYGGLPGEPAAITSHADPRTARPVAARNSRVRRVPRS
jgi:hypothetical protein